MPRVDSKKFFFTKEQLLEKRKSLKELNQWIKSFWSSIAKRIKNIFSDLEVKHNLELFESIVTLDSAREYHLRHCKDSHRSDHCHKRNHSRNLKNTRIRKHESIPPRNKKKCIYVHRKSKNCCLNYQRHAEKFMCRHTNDLTSCSLNCVESVNWRKYYEDHLKSSRAGSKIRNSQGLCNNQCSVRLQQQQQQQHLPPGGNWIHSVCLGSVWRSDSELMHAPDERRNKLQLKRRRDGYYSDTTSRRR